MDFNQILELVRTVSASNLTSFQYEEGNQKILMQLGNGGMESNVSGLNVTPEVSSTEEKVTENVVEIKTQVPVSNTVNDGNSVNNTNTVNMEETGNLVTSPLVGRFYAAPSEDADAFVKVGDTVKKGQVLAIVEAMKLMNEIESDFDGVVAEILVENAQAVEYGQPLFRIV